MRSHTLIYTGGKTNLQHIDNHMHTRTKAAHKQKTNTRERRFRRWMQNHHHERYTPHSGLRIYCGKLHNEGRCPSCEQMCQRTCPSGHCCGFCPHDGSRGDYVGMCSRCALWCGCCLGAACYACIGTVMLWIGFVIILLQIVASMTLCLVFVAILTTCPEATKFVSSNIDLANRTAQEIRNYYQTSGVKVGIDYISQPPISLDIATEVERILDETGANAADFQEALDEFCEHFDGKLLEGSLLIAIGAFVAIIAQVIVMVYQSKYLTMWYYEVHLHSRAKAREKKEPPQQHESKSTPVVAVVATNRPPPPRATIELMDVPPTFPAQNKPHQAPFPS